MTPCFPGYFAYFVFTPCFDASEEWKFFPHGIFHLLILPLMFRFILHLAPSLTMEFNTYTNLHCLCLTNYHYLFWKDVQEHGNISRAVQLHQELNMLTTYYNQIHGNVLSVSMELYLSVHLILAVYAILGTYQEINLVLLLYFAAFTFNCFFAILVGDGAYKANVNKVSVEILARIKAATYFRMKKIMKRYLSSWSSAKIRLGSTNFYDKESPLSLINFCVSQIVNLLLI